MQTCELKRMHDELQQTHQTHTSRLLLTVLGSRCSSVWVLHRPYSSSALHHRRGRGGRQPRTRGRAAGSPADEAAVTASPAGEVAAAGSPADEAAAAGRPADEVPAAGSPTDEAVAAGSPVDEVAAAGSPADEAAAAGSPAGEAAVAGNPVDEVPAAGSPADEVPAAGSPTDEAAAAGSLTDEVAAAGRSGTKDDGPGHISVLEVVDTGRSLAGRFAGAAGEVSAWRLQDDCPAVKKKNGGWMSGGEGSLVGIRIKSLPESLHMHQVVWNTEVVAILPMCITIRT